MPPEEQREDGKQHAPDPRQPGNDGHRFGSHLPQRASSHPAISILVAKADPYEHQ